MVEIVFRGAPGCFRGMEIYIGEGGRLGEPRGSYEGGRRALRGWARPLPRGPLVAPLTYLLRLYILPYPENIQEHHDKLFPPLQPSVSARSHLGAFVGVPPEGESAMEVF